MKLINYKITPTSSAGFVIYKIARFSTLNASPSNNKKILLASSRMKSERGGFFYSFFDFCCFNSYLTEISELKRSRVIVLLTRFRFRFCNKINPTTRTVVR